MSMEEKGEAKPVGETLNPLSGTRKTRNPLAFSDLHQKNLLLVEEKNIEFPGHCDLKDHTSPVSFHLLSLRFCNASMP